MLHVLLCHAAGGGDCEFKKTFNCMLLCWDLVLPAGIVYPSRRDCNTCCGGDCKVVLV